MPPKAHGMTISELKMTIGLAVILEFKYIERRQLSPSAVDPGYGK